MKTLLWFPALLGALVACNASNNETSTPDAACSTQKFFPDSDGDGFGDDAKAVEACEAPAGFVARGGDCNDEDAAIHPGAAEVCDGVDNDCNGQIDDADANVEGGSTFYRDADGDGFGDPNVSQKACAAPGWTAIAVSSQSELSAT